MDSRIQHSILYNATTQGTCFPIIRVSHSYIQSASFLFDIRACWKAHQHSVEMIPQEHIGHGEKALA